jgi:hypothetical protein
MNAGPGGAHWKPVTSAIDAAVHCYRWSGGGVPAMRVVDQTSDEVVWQVDYRPTDPEVLEEWELDRDPRDQPGPDVIPPWHQAVLAAARAQAEADRDETPTPATAQDALW